MYFNYEAFAVQIINVNVLWMHFTHDSPTEDIFEFFFLSTDILKSNIAFFFFFLNSDQGGKLSKHECLLCKNLTRPRTHHQRMTPFQHCIIVE